MDQQPQAPERPQKQAQSTVILVSLAFVAFIVAGLIFLYGRGTIQGMSISSNTAPSSVPPAPAGSGAAAAVVPFEQLAQGAQSTVASRVNYLITSSDELAKLWKMLGTSTPPPAVDFSKDSVVAVFAGQQPSAGYGITISKIEDTTTARTVIVGITKPGPNCASAQALTAPYEIAQVPKTSLPLTHEDQVATQNCQ